MDRRESLTLLAGAAAMLAGCNGLAGSSSSSSDVAGNGERTVTDGPSSGTETDPEALLVRVDSDGKPVWLSDADGDGPPTPRRRERHLDSVVVDTDARADRLSMVDDVDAEAVGSFLDSTDFDAETVYVETIRVEECFRLDLCRISWQADEVSTDYSRRTRPYDERCGVDERVFETRLIRIPDPLDADSVRGHGSSIGTGACHRSRPGPGAEGGESSGEATAPESGEATPAEANTTDGGEQ